MKTLLYICVGVVLISFAAANDLMDSSTPTTRAVIGKQPSAVDTPTVGQKNEFYLTYGLGINSGENGIKLTFVKAQSSSQRSDTELYDNTYVDGKNYKERLIVYRSDRSGSNDAADKFYNECSYENSNGDRQSKIHFYIKTNLYINNLPVITTNGTDADFYMMQYKSGLHNRWIVCSSGTISKGDDGITVKTSDNSKYKISRKNNHAFWVDKLSTKQPR